VHVLPAEMASFRRVQNKISPNTLFD
jgi:hypothetical protein